MFGVHCNLLTAPGVWVAVITAALQATGSADPIQDEKGFEGAVRVTQRWEDDKSAYVTVEIPYRDIHGKLRRGQGRIYYTPDLLASERGSPVYCSAYYELSQQDAREYCDLGFMVVTPHYGKHRRDLPFGDGYNLMKALVQWVRRLPCVDRNRLQIGGESAGGYMTLAMGAEFFPVAALTPNVPAVNWSYGCSYLQTNLIPSGSSLPPGAMRPLPVLALIAPGVDLATKIFGPELSAASWYTLSPISYLDRITAPTLVVCATGDMLCTLEQFTARQFFTLPSGQFPEGYRRDFDALTPDPAARRRLDECIPAENLSVHVMPLPEGLHEFTHAEARHPEKATHGLATPPELDLPWSTDKQWSLVILDEGSPLPHTGHTRFYWNTRARSFMAHHRDHPNRSETLNRAKLQRLMERYAGHLTEVSTLADDVPVNRLNFSALERLDVLVGLLDYASMSRDRAKRLEDLYLSCSVKPFGERLLIEDLRASKTRLSQ